MCVLLYSSYLHKSAGSMSRSAPVVRFVFSPLAIFSIFSLTAVAQQPPPLPVHDNVDDRRQCAPDDASCGDALSDFELVDHHGSIVSTDVFGTAALR